MPIPKKVQWEIDRLKIDLAAARKDLVIAMSRGIDQSRIHALSWCEGTKQTEIPIPEDRIRFQTKSGPVTVYLDQQGDLQISGEEGIWVHPRAANLIHVRIQRL